MKFFMAAAALLSVIAPGARGKCQSDASPPRGVVCIVNPTGHVHQGAEIQALYFTKGTAIIVEKTDAACARDTSK